MKRAKLPAGWDEERILKVLKHYEHQTEQQAVREDEAAFTDGTTVMCVPHALVPLVRELIAKHQR